MVDDAKVVSADVAAGNRVIHVIDTVLDAELTQLQVAGRDRLRPATAD